MMRFIISVILFLFIVHLGHSVTENEKKIVEKGNSVKLNVETAKNAATCVLMTNHNKSLEYSPNSGKIREDIATTKIGFLRKTCSVEISQVNETHAGVWKITANNTIKEFVLYIEQDKSAVPLKYIRVYEGYFISMTHEENYKTLTACNLIRPGKKLPINLLVEKHEGFELFGQCGVRMKVNTSYSGTWRINAVMSEFVSYYIPFRLDVQQIIQDLNDTWVVQWSYGTEQVISLKTDAKICQIFNPDGKIVKTVYAKTAYGVRCAHTVNVATSQHEGEWVIRYNMDGMLGPVNQRIKVEIRDVKVFNAGVDYFMNDTDRPRVFCQIESGGEFSTKLCSFVRPDNKIFYITSGISTNRYTSWEIYNDTFYKCGLIIYKPKDVDYGAWQCVIKIKNDEEKLYGSIIHFEPDNSSKYKNVNATSIQSQLTAEDVYVKHGDPFTIKCNTENALMYCWLRSPNGTSYSIISQHTTAMSPFVLPYTGRGLTFGECEVKISAADYSDHGKWNCFMGMINGTEQSAEVSVTVTESYVVAEPNKVAVKNRNYPHYPVLSCRIIPSMLDKAVHYCRWIRPDGYRIYNYISGRYQPDNSYTLCRLTILNYSPKVDDGNWTCVAGLMGQQDIAEENQAHIILYHSPNIIEASAVIGIIIGSTLLLLATIGTIGYITIRKRRILPPEDPPSYCSHKCAPSESLHYQFDTKKSEY